MPSRNGYEPIDAGDLIPRMEPALKLRGTEYMGYVNDKTLYRDVEMEVESARQVWRRALIKARDEGGDAAPREWKLYVDTALCAIFPQLSPDDASKISSQVASDVLVKLGWWTRTAAAEDAEGKAPTPSPTGGQRST